MRPLPRPKALSSILKAFQPPTLITRPSNRSRSALPPKQPRPKSTMAQQPDYTTWSPTSLINRITDLESQLRAQNSAYTSTNPPTNHLFPNPSYKKPKKAPKPFDPSRYTTRLIALKFAYLGGAYNGFEHHSNNKTPLPTIEEELWRALRKVKLIFPDFKEGRGEEEVEWEGCEYSKCGRTDKGVSAFGQVVGVRVRSARPAGKAKAKLEVEEGDGNGEEVQGSAVDGENEVVAEEPEFDPVKDELPYIQLLNRVLPPDIRILAWCPDPPADFSARFNCKERRYRYFFTNPAYAPLPGNSLKSGEGWLDIEAMHEAAQKYEGLHDFRNFCKIDPSKQITNFERRIFHAGIHAVGPGDEPGSLLSQQAVQGNGSSTEGSVVSHTPKLYWFEVRGSAFLWHQVRHLIAVLFLVGQGWEKPSIVDELLDVHKTPSRPKYDMASDTPLVLWDCVFPDPEKLSQADHADSASPTGYKDGMNWLYVGDSSGGQDKGKRNPSGVEDGKYGRGGVMEDLWTLWRKCKMDEVLAGSLMNVVGRQGKLSSLRDDDVKLKSDRVYDGSELPRTVGTYVPVMQRERMEEAEVVNARYAARKGLEPRRRDREEVDGDE